MENKLDVARVSEDKTIMKELQAAEKVLLSTKLTKINHVEKRQLRILLLTDRYIYNILPDSTFLSLFSRIKRKIPYSAIQAMTVSRFGNEFVIHVEREHDYRFSCPNFKIKVVETVVDCYWRIKGKKMELYYYDDLTLEAYTTTIIDLEKGIRKEHAGKPLLLDPQSLQQSVQAKGESKLIFKAQGNAAVENFQQFQLLKVLGRGAFGKVMLCQKKGSDQFYAVKSMRKENLIEKEHIQKTRTERELLQIAKHPFLVSLVYAFQTRQKIFFVMEFLSGGEMYSHLRKAHRFLERRAKFYAAQVFMALNYLHSMGYVYRDLKPENILFDVDGYIKVSDYGLAKKLKPGQKTYSLAGTPDYVSPQVISNVGQTFATDWWAFGVLIFEMIYGNSPFYNRDHQRMYNDILNRPLFFNDSIVVGSPEMKQLVQGLLNKDPTKRLGTASEDDIKNHPWFADINWTKLYNKSIPAEFIPPASSITDLTNFDQEFTSQPPINSLLPSDLLLLSKFEKQFNGLDFRPT